MLFLSLGSNEGHELENLLEACRQIKGKIIRGNLKCSAVYETPPWGNLDQKPFLNMAVAGETQLLPEQVLEEVLQIEQKMGRLRAEKWGPRMIDIDLLFQGRVVLNTPELTLPHPFADQRLFVLKPMLDLAPDFIHPVVGKTMRELADACLEEHFKEKMTAAEFRQLLNSAI